jgi:hypothetical protein
MNNKRKRKKKKKERHCPSHGGIGIMLSVSSSSIIVEVLSRCPLPTLGLCIKTIALQNLKKLPFIINLEISLRICIRKTIS